MSVLTVRHIKKSFDNKEVLKDISLHVDEGEVVSILGPSGSGKSTLLRCATFLERAEGGEITYGENKIVKDISGHAVYPPRKELQKAQSNFGLVFQNFNLFPHFSVLKNVSDAPITIQRREKEEVYREVRELLAKVGLEEKEAAYPCELSGGQQQRVAIARALALQPDILCFDEPTSALDPELTGEVLKVIRSLAKQRTTMIIVTHEMAFARDVADSVIFMDGGVIVEQGDARDVIEHPREERTRQFLARYAQG